MNSRERVLCALAGETPDRVPFAEPSVDQPPVQEIAGVTRHLSELEITRLLQRDILPLEATPPIFADEKVAADGQAFYTNPWIKTEADLERIRWPDPINPEFRQAAEDCIRQRGDYATVALIRLGISPTYISMGFEAFSTALLDNPSLVQEVLQRFTRWSARRIDYLQEVGFDFLWSFDDIAYKTATFVSPRMFRELLLPVVKPTISHISVPWVFHSDGNLSGIVDDLVNLGISGLHPFEPGAMDIRKIKSKYGKRLCVLGNVNVDTLARGTPAEVEHEVMALLRDVAPSGGYMLTASNSIPHYARPENVLAMVKTLNKYGNYPISLP
jgi:uroporphyrinogen decarboxylase